MTPNWFWNSAIVQNHKSEHISKSFTCWRCLLVTFSVNKLNFSSSNCSVYTLFSNIRILNWIEIYWTLTFLHAAFFWIYSSNFKDLFSRALVITRICIFINIIRVVHIHNRIFIYSWRKFSTPDWMYCLLLI